MTALLPNLLKTSELEKNFFIKVVDIFESFHFITYFPNSDIGPKSYGHTTKNVHRGAKNLDFGAVWVEIPCYSEKKTHCRKKT